MGKRSLDEDVAEASQRLEVLGVDPGVRNDGVALLEVVEGIEAAHVHLAPVGEDEVLVRPLERDLVEAARIKVRGVERAVLNAVDADEGLVKAKGLERALGERAHEGAGVVAVRAAYEDDLADVPVRKEVEDGEAVGDDAQRDGGQVLRRQLDRGARPQEDGLVLVDRRGGDLRDVGLLLDVEELSLKVGGLADKRASERGVGRLGPAAKAHDAALVGELHEVAADGHVGDAEDVGNLAYGDRASRAAHLDYCVVSLVLKHVPVPLGLLVSPTYFIAAGWRQPPHTAPSRPNGRPKRRTSRVKLIVFLPGTSNALARRQIMTAYAPCITKPSNLARLLLSVGYSSIEQKQTFCCT